MTRNPRLYLKDILSAIESIERFVEGLDYETFTKDDKTSSAVILKFQIIGEATKRIPRDIRNRNPDVPWKSMAGMRNKLNHAYFGIDYRLVWDAIKIALPKIKPRIIEVIDDTPNSS